MGRKSKQTQRRRKQIENEEFDAIELGNDTVKRNINEPKTIYNNMNNLSKKQKKKNRHKKSLAISKATMDVIMDEASNQKQEKYVYLFSVNEFYKFYELCALFVHFVHFMNFIIIIIFKFKTCKILTKCPFKIVCFNFTDH